MDIVAHVIGYASLVVLVSEVIAVVKAVPGVFRLPPVVLRTHLSGSLRTSEVHLGWKRMRFGFFRVTAKNECLLLASPMWMREGSSVIPLKGRILVTGSGELVLEGRASVGLIAVVASWPFSMAAIAPVLFIPGIAFAGLALLLFCGFARPELRRCAEEMVTDWPGSLSGQGR